MQLRDYVDDLREAGAELLALHCEGSTKGTERFARKQNLGFPLGNDGDLNVVPQYSVTSTYLIDREGVIRGRWLDRVHDRVGGATLLAAVRQLNRGGQ